MSFCRYLTITNIEITKTTKKTRNNQNFQQMAVYQINFEKELVLLYANNKLVYKNHGSTSIQ